ncbi:hypothetical protein B0H12DRAFT_1127070 [Mycena haematopus]|nr:hypothetical protein B0H12DRAFT_1127070 [Mycena haematopus]
MPSSCARPPQLMEAAVTLYNASSALNRSITFASSGVPPRHCTKPEHWCRESTGSKGSQASLYDWGRYAITSRFTSGSIAPAAEGVDHRACRRPWEVVEDSRECVELVIGHKGSGGKEEMSVSFRRMCLT